MTVLRPTSLPVPAVVAMAIMGGTLALDSRCAIQLIVILLKGKWMGSHQADGLGNVERAAAAQADDAVAIPASIGLQSFSHVLLHGIGIHVVKKRRVQACPPRFRQNLLGESARDHAAVRDHKRRA